MKKVLVVGANGQLGSELKYLASDYPDWEFDFRSRRELDIVDGNAISCTLESDNYDFLINCAAYTAVDKAEKDVVRAYAINADGAARLAAQCLKNKVKFIHISTDYVFDGTRSTLYRETDSTNPINVYGATKERGENLVYKINLESVIFRTSWLYSSFGDNFVKTILRLGNERTQLNIVSDQIGTPTYARDFARVILESINSGRIQKMKGIYHYTNEGLASWYDFAVAIIEIGGLRCEVLPIDTLEYPLPAKRPNYSVLSKHKTKQALGLKIPYWRDSLKKCIQTIKDNNYGATLVK